MSKIIVEDNTKPKSEDQMIEILSGYILLYAHNMGKYSKMPIKNVVIAMFEAAEEAVQTLMKTGDIKEEDYYDINNRAKEIAQEMIQRAIDAGALKASPFVKLETKVEKLS